jgi:hypothetical protein
MFLLWLEDDLHALVLLVLERLEAVRRLAERQAMRDHEARVDVALLDVLVERLHIPLHVALARLHRQALVHERAGGELVHEPAVDADHRDDAARTAGEDRVAQGVATIGLRPRRLLDPVDRVHEAVTVRGLHPDGVDHRVGPAPAGQLLELLDDVGVLGEVHDVGRPRLVPSHLQAVGVLVDRDDPLSAEHHGAGDRELPDRPRTEDGDDLAAGDLAEVGAHVPRREDVGEEQDLLVGQIVLDLDRTDVGERHPGVLRLAPRVAARQARVAEDPGG